MQIQQFIRKNGQWMTPLPDQPDHDTVLLLCFGRQSLLFSNGVDSALRESFPQARLVGCSTAGEIMGTKVLENTLTVTALSFSRATIAIVSSPVQDDSDSRSVGRHVAQQLPPEELRHVLLLSDGLKVNGSELVQGAQDALPHRVKITGGLAGDYQDFTDTSVWVDAPMHEGLVAAIGFYGDSLRIGYGSMGGWDAFGPDWRISKSERNILFELDKHSALSLYKDYLGDYANGLPATALLFPLLVKLADNHYVVRTILGINESEQSMTFAGDMPQGAAARFMKANFERLVEGAASAAEQSRFSGGRQPQLALLVSCVGRKMVLKQRTEEEVESVREVLGADTAICGFYSYGEISPVINGVGCSLHNQTMTITTISED
ncbi:hypothetical protein ENC22_19995 [Hahella sp. KA22]|uniref:FIST signal transduction protein n=1 Tax=Hahella sp. KA22 TaxID=1628392 RepID=UPI000FDE55E7|nr:FIST N-terminal domain-containing protein [Hahella sp. KA22]AZZ93355.1 hypothetical protein ENC22_19995 [Hahella sp. KA22]